MLTADAPRPTHSLSPLDLTEADADVRSVAALQVQQLTGDAQKRNSARFLYWQGWRITSIAEYLGIPRTTIHGWKDGEEWDKASPLDRVEGALEARMVKLVLKDSKTGGDYKEIDLLGRQLERTARVRKYGETGKEGDLNPAIAARNAEPKRRPTRNAFTEAQVEKLESVFRDSLFGYQNVWWRNGHQRTRMILKSRQIGATWYFAREALLDAILTGRNQIFLSASKAQAHVFKQYIIQFALEAGVELSGDPIVLANGAHLYFLGSNFRTAQSYHGNFYFDEFFWTQKFEELNKVASAMATHKQWRKTYFSTPSAMSHAAYPYWTGERKNRNRKAVDKIILDLSHKALRGGALCLDRVWRDIVTVEDAEASGCDLFDIAELRDEYAPDEFANLFMCDFIDDSASMFPLSEMQACMVDSWVEWADDFKPFTQRPYGHRPVWVGYDPAHTGDSAGLVVIAPPAAPGGVFRILERIQFRGMDYEAQAEMIRQTTQRYNVTYMAIDATGMGAGVLQIVQKFYPQVVALQYSVELKTRLVLKAKQVISKGRLQFDAGHVDIAQAFMAIRKTLTASGRQATFESGRTDATGHADLAWAVMHALDNESLAGEVQGSGNVLEIF